MNTPRLRWLLVFFFMALFLTSVRGAASVEAGLDGYRNPLVITIPSGGRVESCADPTIIRGRTTGDTNWYMYCTTDPLNDEDKTGDNFNFRFIPMLQSSDLVNWTYMGDAFAERPDWVGDTAGLWAPEIVFFDETYYLYYGASETDQGGSAIGVATSASPLGPWVDSGAPVVEPHEAPCCPDSRRWVFDPEVVQENGVRYIFYGSYFGGISARQLSADGLSSDPETQTQITIANRYEGAEVVRVGGFWYLFASATNCCNGPLTGYSVFVGRSQNLLGPYVDRTGASFLQGRVGGTPSLTMNGNRWVGVGHNSVFRDFDGQWWTVYHAVDRNDPCFEGTACFTKRPVLLDPIDWIDGFPYVRGGRFASNNRMPAPAAQRGEDSQYTTKLYKPDNPGKLRGRFSDEFDGNTLNPRWTWVREPSEDTFGVEDGTFRFDTQAGDLFVDSNNASVLTEQVPAGEYIVETRVQLNLPPEDCCFNFVQAGLVIYGSDDNFLKLTHVSIFETRQTEWAKEQFPVPSGYPRYGNTVVGPPAEWTWLRIVKRDVKGNGGGAGTERYTAYTSRDGVNWERGGTWAHSLGEDARIGLVAMGGAGFVANFDYVRVYGLLK